MKIIFQLNIVHLKFDLINLQSFRRFVELISDQSPGCFCKINSSVATTCDAEHSQGALSTIKGVVDKPVLPVQSRDQSFVVPFCIMHACLGRNLFIKLCLFKFQHSLQSLWITFVDTSGVFFSEGLEIDLIC
jgi:hypothetical protein